MVQSGCAKSHHREKEKFLEVETISIRRKFDKKKAKRAFAEAMKEEAVKEMDEIRNDKNVVFRRIRMGKKKTTDLAGNNCIKSKMGGFYLPRNVARECGRSTWRPS